MAQISITGYVYSVQSTWADKPTFEVFASDTMETLSGAHYTYSYIGSVDVPFTLPEGWSPQAAQIAAVEARKAAALASYQAEVAACNERLAKLTAIGCEVAA